MRKVLSKIKRAIFGDYFLKKTFFNGVQEFKQTGFTQDAPFQAMISLYCSSNGKFNEDYQERIEKENPSLKVPGAIESVIGKVDSKTFNAINNELNEDGYVRFENRIPQSICNKLYDYALKNGSKVPPKYDSKIIYDPLNPIAEIYRFDMADLVNNKDIQALMMDEALLNIARNYLQSEPIFDFPAMWWSSTFSKEASSEAAQLYHFDMDRLKWLKIFIYLNDVDLDNGPHSYIRGSHKVGAKPMSLLKKGYIRIEDKELEPFYRKEDFITLIGQQGEIFAGDTKCWHKGNPLKKGHRLVLEFQYTNFLFGANYPKLVVSDYSDEFKKFCENNPVYASKISFK
jgi:hypothetical protein